MRLTIKSYNMKNNQSSKSKITSSKKLVFAFMIIFFSGANFENAHSISFNYIKRLGANCTGVCDQPSQVCTNNKELQAWCDKNCGHKFSRIEVCAHYSIPVPSEKCPLTIEDSALETNAAKASQLAYSWGENGGYTGSDFKEVGHLKGKTLTIAWAGVKDCALYIAYRGTKTKTDVYKDLQIGISTVSKELGLGQATARGLYNDSILEGIEFYDNVIKSTRIPYSKIVITGHSLGGALAQGIGDKVSRGQKIIKIYTFNAPGGDFMTNKVGEGHKDTEAEHVRTKGDIVSKIGTKTVGTEKTYATSARNPLDAHKIKGLSEHLDNK